MMGPHSAPALRPPPRPALRHQLDRAVPVPALAARSPPACRSVGRRRTASQLPRPCWGRPTPARYLQPRRQRLRRRHRGGRPGRRRLRAGPTRCAVPGCGLPGPRACQPASSRHCSPFAAQRPAADQRRRQPRLSTKCCLWPARPHAAVMRRCWGHVFLPSGQVQWPRQSCRGVGVGVPARRRAAVPRGCGCCARLSPAHSSHGSPVQNPARGASHAPVPPAAPGGPECGQGGLQPTETAAGPVRTRAQQWFRPTSSQTRDNVSCRR